MNTFLLHTLASAVGAFVGITGGYYWMRWSGARTAKKISVAQQQTSLSQRQVDAWCDPSENRYAEADTISDQVRRKLEKGEPPR